MLTPKKQKYRKQFRGGAKTASVKGSSLSFGDYGLKSIERCWLFDKQIEAGRRAITRLTQRGGKVWIRVFPDKPVTKKAAGTRMGSGKGDIVGYVVPITPGRMIYEISGVPKDIAQEALRQAAMKFPFKTKFVTKDN